MGGATLLKLATLPAGQRVAAVHHHYDSLDKWNKLEIKTQMSPVQHLQG